MSSSSVTSITLEDFVLTEDSSDEIKMRALKILMSKAENAKHRIADLQSVTLADIESGNQSLSHIRQHVTYIVPFLQSIPAEVKVRWRKSAFSGVNSFLPSFPLFLRPQLSPLRSIAVDTIKKWTFLLNKRYIAPD